MHTFWKELVEIATALVQRFVSILVCAYCLKNSHVLMLCTGTDDFFDNELTLQSHHHQHDKYNDDTSSILYGHRATVTPATPDHVFAEHERCVAVMHDLK